MSEAKGRRREVTWEDPAPGWEAGRGMDGVAYQALRVQGRVLHRGGRVATAEGRVTDGSGRLYAHATSTALLLGDKG